MSDDMTPELKARLMERLSVRADRLSKMAAQVGPSSVVAFMAEHVVTTAILLLGDKFADAVFSKLIISLRDSNGICMCGNGLKAEGEPLCQPCIDQVEEDDRQCEEHLAMYRPTRGEH